VIDSVRAHWERLSDEGASEGGRKGR
jgi:hypothetical protein